jgi:hypothetical protein
MTGVGEKSFYITCFCLNSMHFDFDKILVKTKIFVFNKNYVKNYF